MTLRLLAIFCCYDNSPNACEADGKIAAGEKNYHGISSITIKKAGYQEKSGVSKKNAKDILKFAQKKGTITGL